MLRVLIVLFWVGLLIGTLLAHNIVANWAVALAGLYFLARWWNHRCRERRAAKAPVPATRTNPGHGASESSAAGPSPATPQPRSRWTVDRVHAAGPLGCFATDTICPTASFTCAVEWISWSTLSPTSAASSRTSITSSVGSVDLSPHDSRCPLWPGARQAESGAALEDPHV